MASGTSAPVIASGLSARSTEDRLGRGVRQGVTDLLRREALELPDARRWLALGLRLRLGLVRLEARLRHQQVDALLRQRRPRELPGAAAAVTVAPAGVSDHAARAAELQRFLRAARGAGRHCAVIFSFGSRNCFLPRPVELAVRFVVRRCCAMPYLGAATEGTLRPLPVTAADARDPRPGAGGLTAR